MAQEVEAPKNLGLGPVPGWVEQLAELYFSGTTNTFVLSGNTRDLFLAGSGEPGRTAPLEQMLAEQLFGRWDLVLTFDLARGLRCQAGADPERLRRMNAWLHQLLGDVAELRRDPSLTLAALDRALEKLMVAEAEHDRSLALLIGHASLVFPRGEALSPAHARHVVTCLNWASNPYLKRRNVCVVLHDAESGALSERITGHPHVASIAVPLPDQAARTQFLTQNFPGLAKAEHSELTLAELARYSAGVALSDLDVLVRSGEQTGQKLTRARFQELKKRLIERQARGLLEFVEPKWTLEMVVGHEASKQRLLADAELLRRGRFEAVPMGYLICGPVGTGKTFLATCMAGSIGIPCVVLKNFRSKYVGETEANLERVLGVLRSMGPAVVVIDEADAMLGDRGDSGDSGVSSRVFGAIAAQMGDTRYRGKILWMLLTARPDNLPIDLKRQGRAEVHIPLFYPQTTEELSRYFQILAKKVGARLTEDALPKQLPHLGQLSGADVEAILGRAHRRALLEEREAIDAAGLGQVLAEFMPSLGTTEKELQELAAVVECTDREFLPPRLREQIEAWGGRSQLVTRLEEMRARQRRF